MHVVLCCLCRAEKNFINPPAKSAGGNPCNIAMVRVYATAFSYESTAKHFAEPAKSDSLLRYEWDFAVSSSRLNRL